MPPEDVPHPLATLVEMVPEHDDRFPLTLVFDAFVDRVADALREGGEAELVRRAFAFAEGWRRAASRPWTPC